MDKKHLELHGQGNLIQCIFQTTGGEIGGNDYKPTQKFFQKRASDCYLQWTSAGCTVTSLFKELKATPQKRKLL